MLKRFVNWFEEELDQFYGDDNQELIYGIYYYEDPNDFPIEVEWFRTEQDRLNA